jgi:thioredoxin reductase
MIDLIELTTTATFVEKGGFWYAEIKGYPVSGTGESPEEAVEDARDQLHRFYTERMGSRTRFVSVTHEPISLKAALIVKIETDRGTTLSEFGLSAGREEQGGSE